MSIKQRLYSYSQLSRELEQINDKILSLRDRMYAIRSTSDVCNMPSGAGNQDQIGEVVSTLTDLEDMYFSKSNAILLEQKEIEIMIQSLEPVERVLIRSRYIESKPWEAVCGVIGYSWQHTHRLHSKILKKLKM